MKKVKKIYAWLLSFVMLASVLAVTGIRTEAADPETGSITVHKLRVETNEEYEGLTDRADGNEITDGSLDRYEPLEGITFTLIKVQETDDLTVENAQPDSSFAQRQLTTEVDGVIKFDNLPLGVYKLTEEDSPAVKEAMEPVLIQVPTYNQVYKKDPSQPEFIYDIHVYPKNLVNSDGPDIDKDVKVEDNQHASADIGESFPWIISTDIPEGIENGQHYIIKDTLDSRLDYDSEVTPVVKMRAEGGSETELTADTDYTFSTGDSGRDLTWTMTPAGLTKLAGAVNGKVIITFNTKINGTAEMGTAIENQAKLDYLNQAGEQYVPRSPKPEVHTGGVRIKKVDKENPATVLEGAEFKIYTSEADAKAGTNAVQREGKDYVATSGADGFAVFTGLEYGINGQSATEGSSEYWIVETKAPTKDGEQYNRLKDPVKVTVNATSHQDENAIEIRNSKDGFELPFTGGIGRIIFMAAGLALIGAAIVVMRRGGKKEKN